MKKAVLENGSTMPKAQRSPKWPLERALFAIGGSVTLVSALLAAVVSPWFLCLTAFVGLNQWIYVATGACPVSVILNRFGIAAECRW